MLQRLLNLYWRLRSGEKALVWLTGVLLPVALLSMISKQAEQGNAETVFDGITAFAAVAAAWVAWWTIREQNKRAQLTLSVNLTEQFVDKWESTPMKQTRKNAAAYTLRATSARLPPTGTNRSDRDALLDVLNFFDRLGTVVRSDAIDVHFIWNEFFPTVRMYWLGAEPLVQEWRAETNRDVYFIDVEYLSKTLLDYEKTQTSRSDAQIEADFSEKKVRDFLQGETNLAL